QTRFYRVFALKKLWRALDGPKTKSPVHDIAIKRMKSRRPVRVLDSTIAAVAKKLEEREQPRIGKQGQQVEPILLDAKSRARFMVLATTGQRPAQMKLAQPDDVDLKHGVWWVRQSKGGDPIPVYLSDDMIAAWELFIAVDAWGTYDVRNFARVLRNA